MRTAKLLTILALLMVTALSQGYAMSIEAEVDRSEVAFGETLSLVVTLTQELGSGRTQTFGLPRISSIPGFDIVSTRSGQSTSFINGVGSSRTQVVYELVPQEPGKFTIPAFSFADGSGNTHSTKPIEITVLPPPAHKEEPEDERPASEPSRRAEEGSSLFKAMLVLGLLLAAIIAPVMILSSVSGRRSPAAAGRREAAIEDAEVVEAVAPSAVPPRQAIDFAAEVARLKRQHPEADKAFYQQYFELFGRAALAGSNNLSESMTSDEMLKKAAEMCSSDVARQACRRLAGDIELTLYANRAPARAFSAIDADARDIINAIMQ
ncbi:MAG: protein BatD [Candidatus Riflebacteria bacterium]|nr:protein BatD [Candidatus Riflebacteria bacterium]